MIESAGAFNDPLVDVRLQEGIGALRVQGCEERRAVELKMLERDISRLVRIGAPCPRVDEGEAVKVFQRGGSAEMWGDDLRAEEETLLVEDYETPIVDCKHPKEAKAVSMQEDPADPRTVALRKDGWRQCPASLRGRRFVLLLNGRPPRPQPRASVTEHR